MGFPFAAVCATITIQYTVETDVETAKNTLLLILQAGALTELNDTNFFSKYFSVHLVYIQNKIEYTDRKKSFRAIDMSIRSICFSIRLNDQFNFNYFIRQAKITLGTGHPRKIFINNVTGVDINGQMSPFRNVIQI